MKQGATRSCGCRGTQEVRQGVLYRKCPRCHRWKVATLANFTRKQVEEFQSGISNTCRPCSRKRVLASQMKWAVFWNRRCGAARHRARQSRVAHTITARFLEALYAKQGGRCAVTDLPMQIPTKSLGRGFTEPHSISVDRIVPSRGYVPGNVRLVCWSVNTALNKWGAEVFDQMCKARVSMLTRKQ